MWSPCWRCDEQDEFSFGDDGVVLALFDEGGEWCSCDGFEFFGKFSGDGGFALAERL